MPQAELANERAVALEVAALKIVQEPAPAPDEHQQPAARVVVLAVRAQVLGELVDPLGQQRDLDLGLAGVHAVIAELRSISSCLRSLVSVMSLG